ncbi:amidase domain-containing protein [Actinomadura spongiicola]|nr:amidase domain-containing protein [Actinomadura spongiicola]
MKITRRLLAASIGGLLITEALISPAHASDPTSADAAPAPDRARLAAVAQAVYQERADRLTRPPEAKAKAQIAASGRFQAQRAADGRRLEQRRQMYVRLDGGNSHAQVDITPLGLRVAGTKAIFRVQEHTKLYYAGATEEERAQGLDYEEYALDHVLTFRYSGSAWQLDEARPTEKANGAEVPTQFDDGRQTVGAPDPREAPASTARGPSDRALPATSAAAAARKKHIIWYGEKYVIKPNKAYRVYRNDCTNFVSQAQRHAGYPYVGSGASNRKNNKKWFYGRTTKSTSFTWAAAKNWGLFWAYRTLSYRNVWALTPGDLLQADWDGGGKDHTMIVVNWLKGGERLLNYHTRNTRHKKLSRLLAENRKATWYPRGTME